ncbi:MAG TPA: response regulator [Steroidobacteraceae bacterium]|jgi:PAS domain S-box-containing protein
MSSEAGAAQKPGPTATSASHEAAASAQPAVLLVDDQPARLLTYEAVLEGVGVSCVRALSGKEALERLLRQSFAVILLDVSMPEMDGFETARLIREHPRFGRTPIIFITGVHITELDTLRGYEAGAIDYIPVPIMPEILRSKVALLVELYRRRAELEVLNRELDTARARLESERNAALATVHSQRQVEMERAEKEWLSAVLNSMTEEVYFTDVDHRYTYANPAAQREFGPGTIEGIKVEDVVGRLEIWRIDGTPRAAEEAPPLRALKGEVVKDEEQIVRTPRKGEYRRRQVSSAPVRNGSGTIIGCVSVVRDVTDRWHMDEALRRQEARTLALLNLGDQFRSLTSPADLAYAAVKTLGETLNVKRCGYGTVDVDAETMATERDWNAPGSRSLAGVLNLRGHGTHIDELKRGETVVCADVESDARTAATAAQLEALDARSFINVPVIEDGVFVALLYLTDDQPRIWTGEELSFIRDVAERTRIAVERRRHEQAVATDLTHSVLLRDLAGRLVADGDVHTLFDEILAAAMTITEADGGTLQLLDSSTQELVFAAIRGLDPKLTSQFARVGATSGSPCGLALASGKRTFLDFDVPPSQDPDGSARLYLSYGLMTAQSTPLVSRYGRPLGMFSTHWRRRKRLGHRELTSLDVLARQAADVIERTQADGALRHREQQLRDADRRKDEFIAMLAHELRNPLVPIRAGIEVLKNVREQPALIDTVRPVMERQVAHMVRLIDDLLDVSRITSGKIELRRERVTLASVVGGGIEANRAAISAGNLELVVNLREPHWVLEVDPTRMGQVLSNLLQNAAKFTPAGGKIRVESQIEGDREGATELVLSVSDSGVGISTDMLPRVFELFAQASRAGQKADSGLGIGLALARRLVEMHGGTLVARSAGLGQGSEFIVTLPAPRSPQPLQPQAAADNSVLAGVRLLVVDDNRDAADSMAMLIDIKGGLARVAYDGATALAELETQPAQIVLLDIGMAGMDGYEVCRRIRQRFGAGVGVVAISGWGQEQDKQLAARAGFDAHLTKPADPAKLEEAIRRILAGR